MSRDSVGPSAEVEALAVQRGRRFSAAKKQRLVEQTQQPGVNVSWVAPEPCVSPSLLFRWRTLASAGALQAVSADEAVAPVSRISSYCNNFGVHS